MPKPSKKTAPVVEPDFVAPTTAAGWSSLIQRVRYPVLDDRVGTVIDMDLVVSVSEHGGEFCAVVVGGLSQPVIAQLIPKRKEDDDTFLATKALVESVREAFLLYKHICGLRDLSD